MISKPSPREYTIQVIESFAREMSIGVTTWRDPGDINGLSGVFTLSLEPNQFPDFQWPFYVSSRDVFEKGPRAVFGYLDNVIMQGKARMCCGVSI